MYRPLPAISASVPAATPSESIRLVYAPADGIPAPAAGESLLGLVGYGVPLPDAEPAGAPRAEIPLDGLGARPPLEAWYAPGPVEYGEAEGIRHAMNGTVLFGVARMPAGRPDSAARETYLGIVRLVRRAGYPTIFRMWNYLPDINLDQLGLERYRWFCVGRYQAFAESGYTFGEDLPAASAIGSTRGDSWVVFAAGRGSAAQIENPRQLSAYRYPSDYGPRSPSFSRAMVFEAAGRGKTLFISGTASIVGHETAHRGDPVAQCLATVENLRAILRRVGIDGPASLGRRAAWKVYLRNPLDFEAVSACLAQALDPASPVLYLAGDICRDSLLLEIEGVVKL